jgi:uncharacterized protein
MANEITVAEKLKTLYQLQLIDAQIGEIEVLKGELPMEVSDLEDDIVGLETRLEKTVNSVKELQAIVTRFATNIKEAEALKVKYKTQLDNVKNNREYEALTKELEMQDLDVQLAEKRIKQARIDVAKQEESQANTEERLAKKKADLAAKQVELNEIISKTENEERSLRAESDAAREHIEERLIKAYDKIRTSYRNGLAVVTVQRDSCGGCFNKIPPQVQLEISMRKKIVACEHCGRILVDDLILTGDKIAEHQAEFG